MSQINFPTADELDTGNYDRASGFRCNLYLVPADENGGTPRVTYHTGVGTIGVPAPAWHHCWRYIASYGPRVVGESVLSSLREIEDTLIEWSESYDGSRWDGHNYVGQWSDAEDDAREIEIDIENYWEADDWFGHTGIGWTELCDEAGIDPLTALGDSWAEVASDVADIIEPLQDQLVCGIEKYCRDCAETYREENL